MIGETMDDDHLFQTYTNFNFTYVKHCLYKCVFAIL